jgi:hypothetical protein
VLHLASPVSWKKDERFDPNRIASKYSEGRNVPSDAVSRPLADLRQKVCAGDMRARICALAMAMTAVLLPLSSSQGQGERSLWESPTSGRPWSLQYAPQGAQCHFFLRPAAILQSAEAQRTLRALGPAMERGLADWAADRMIDLSTVQRLRVSIPAGRRGTLDNVAVVQWASGKPLPRDWKALDVERRTDDRHSAYYSPGRSSLLAWIPTRNGPTIAVVGPDAAVREIAERPAAVPLLRREMEQLRKQSDADRLFSVLASPQFLRANMGRFDPATKEGLKYLKGLWDEGAQAVEFSAHLSGEVELFLELKLVGTYDSHAALPNRIRGAMSGYVERAGRNNRQSLAGLASRWPQMVSMVNQQLRVANDGDVTIANVTLPAAAAHNLALGSSLFLQRGMAALATNANPSRIAMPRLDSEASVPDEIDAAALVNVLKATVDFSFGQQSLEFALRDLQQLIRDTVDGGGAFEIQMDGPSLRDAGITRNQQISNFDARRRTVAQVLTQLVREADPSRNEGAEASGTEAVLIWAAGPSLQEQKKGQVILITTVRAGKKRGYRIPKNLRNR